GPSAASSSPTNPRFGTKAARSPASGELRRRDPVTKKYSIGGCVKGRRARERKIVRVAAPKYAWAPPSSGTVTLTIGWRERQLGRLRRGAARRAAGVAL